MGKTHAAGTDASSYSGWGAAPIYGEWSGDCYYFAWRANVVAGRTPLSGFGTAKETYNAYLARGLVRTDRNPPAGAVLFWNISSFGHAALATGQGTAVTTVGLDGDGKPVVEKAIDWTNYLGYVVP